MSNISQQEAVTKHLRLGNSITPLEAIGVFKVFRLASIIHRMRRDGYDVQTTMCEDARGGRYARYSLPVR